MSAGYEILMVDDSRTVKSVITKCLNLSGIPIAALREAGNGKEGLDLARERKPDLIFADLNMPVMGGLEMIAALKDDASLRDVPIVVISTEGSDERIGGLKERGIAAFLRKPFRPEALKALVVQILGVENG
ncbi:MAG: response regulator [Fibrobacteres bacterium]|jgi:two-component system chemotaxis response regulator CheY|nr:response regulator [Fibrobacterota bacterium]